MEMVWRRDSSQIGLLKDLDSQGDWIIIGSKSVISHDNALRPSARRSIQLSLVLAVVGHSLWNGLSIGTAALAQSMGLNSSTSLVTHPCIDCWNGRHGDTTNTQGTPVSLIFFLKVVCVVLHHGIILDGLCAGPIVEFTEEAIVLVMLGAL